MYGIYQYIGWIIYHNNYVKKTIKSLSRSSNDFQQIIKTCVLFSAKKKKYLCVNKKIKKFTNKFLKLRVL